MTQPEPPTQFDGGSVVGWVELSLLKELGMPWMTIDRELACHGPLAPSARA